jgi:RND superfamily putative drug exporter
LKLTGGDNRGLPTTTEATRGLALLEHTLGPGALAPNQVVVDTGKPNGAWTRATIDAQRRLVAALRRDPEIEDDTVLAAALLVRAPGGPGREALARARQANLVDEQGRFIQVRAAGRGDSGTEEAMDLVDRIRERYIPSARFGSSGVLLTGAPAFGVDFIDKAYSAFPWLVLAVLAMTYLLLLRAFRSIFLPVKAVFMNVLSVSATYGVLVLVF